MPTNFWDGTLGRPAPREGDHELGPLARSRAELDLAAVRLDELAREGEPQARPSLLRGVEGIEDPLADLRRDPRTVVADAEPHLAPPQVLAGQDAHAGIGRASLLEGVERIADEVDQHAAQLLRVAADRALGIDLALDAHALARGPVLEGRERRVDDVAEADVA